MKEVLSWEKTEDGWQMHVKGYKYPLSGLPKKQTVNASALVKRMVIASVRLVFRFPVVLLPLLVVSKDKLIRGITEWLSDLWRGDYGSLLKIEEEDYSRSIRELLRTLRKINKYSEEWTLLLACIFEIDLAYRRRLQDVIGELDKASLEKNPKKEVLRLLDLAIRRESLSWWQADKVRSLRKIISITWLFKPFREMTISFLKEINIEEMRRTRSDWYWTFDLYDYDYGGLSYEARQKLKEQEHEGWVEIEAPNPQVTEKPKIDINQPNEAFYRLNEEGLEEFTEQAKQLLKTNWRSKQNV